jgi:hypothetical protein
MGVITGMMGLNLNAAGAALKSVFSDGSSSLTEAVWLTHRLLWALPWAARHVHPCAVRVAARALGQIFDSTVLSRQCALWPMSLSGSAGRSNGPAGSEKRPEWACQLPKTASSSQAADAPDSEPLALA